MKCTILKDWLYHISTAFNPLTSVPVIQGDPRAADKPLRCPVFTGVPPLSLCA